MTIKRVQLVCHQCGGKRNHHVLKEHVSESEDESGWWETSKFQICQCQGCDTIRFCEEQTNAGDVGPDGYVPTITSYPEPKLQRHQTNEALTKLPIIGAIYAETVAAFNADCLILAGGGLRATVEAICKEKGIAGKNLQEKIDGLVTQQLLAKPQADLLHEERYIGNSALHEIQRPVPADIAIGVEIVEGLLNTIYILPRRAAELRKAKVQTANATTPASPNSTI